MSITVLFTIYNEELRYLSQHKNASYAAYLYYYFRINMNTQYFDTLQVCRSFRDIFHIDSEVFCIVISSILRREIDNLAIRMGYFVYVR